MNSPAAQNRRTCEHQQYRSDAESGSQIPDSTTFLFFLDWRFNHVIASPVLSDAIGSHALIDILGGLIGVLIALGVEVMVSLSGSR